MDESHDVGHPMDLRMYSMSPRLIGIIPHRQFSQNNDFEEECAVTDTTIAAITFEEGNVLLPLQLPPLTTSQRIKQFRPHQLCLASSKSRSSITW
jgi:hypothetical protein